ncbi:MAG: hypothetical protein ACTSU9_19820, partial [Promethearchaeota archaeon]
MMESNEVREGIPYFSRKDVLQMNFLVLCEEILRRFLLIVDDSACTGYVDAHDHQRGAGHPGGISSFNYFTTPVHGHRCVARSLLGPATDREVAEGEDVNDRCKSALDQLEDEGILEEGEAIIFTRAGLTRFRELCEQGMVYGFSGREAEIESQITEASRSISKRSGFDMTGDLPRILQERGSGNGFAADTSMVGPFRAAEGVHLARPVMGSRNDDLAPGFVDKMRTQENGSENECMIIGTHALEAMDSREIEMEIMRRLVMAALWSINHGRCAVGHDAPGDPAEKKLLREMFTGDCLSIDAVVAATGEPEAGMDEEHAKHVRRGIEMMIRNHHGWMDGDVLRLSIIGLDLFESMCDGDEVPLYAKYKRQVEKAIRKARFHNKQVKAARERDTRGRGGGVLAPDRDPVPGPGLVRGVPEAFVVGEDSTWQRGMREDPDVVGRSGSPSLGVRDESTTGGEASSTVDLESRVPEGVGGAGGDVKVV